MPSFAHKSLLERIARLNEMPDDAAAYAGWIKANDQLSFLRANANEEELVIYGSGKFAFVHTIIVPEQRLFPVDENDLLSWSCSPYEPIASYATGGGRPDIWIERGMRGAGARAFEEGQQLVFGRSFEGLRDEDASYFEILQEYAHLTGIHWRPEQRAYCRFDEHGDFEAVVSVTQRDRKQDIALVSFKRWPLEQYLAASNYSLVRLFDFTLYRPESFNGWLDGDETRIRVADDLFYRQKLAGTQAAYTRGVQIISSGHDRANIFTAMQDEWFGGGGKRYVEFIAQDWRNNRVARMSTDPSATTNYFQAQNNSLPFEVSPAFFRPEVLLKYKGDKDKYTVEAREIHCRGAWTLRSYDVNKAGQVHTYICYLRNLPYEEQLYWASYNEAPKAPISERALTNDFEGAVYVHSDPLQKVLVIVRRLAEKAPSWWKLRDETLLRRVSIHRTASRDEWAEAFMDLSKLIVEGFEPKALRAQLVAAGVDFDLKDQSLVLLEKLLAGKPKVSDREKLAGLRAVQLIRTKAKGHSGGSEGKKLAADALKQHETFGAHFEHVCGVVASELERIERSLL